MNVVTINGYISSNGTYKVDEDGESKYTFIVSVQSPLSNTTNQIPVMCVKLLADECQSRLNIEDYVEITGELERNGNKVYVLASALIHKKSKARSEYVMRSTQFLQTYAPDEIMERIEKQLEKKRLRNEKSTKTKSTV